MFKSMKNRFVNIVHSVKKHASKLAVAGIAALGTAATATQSHAVGTVDFTGVGTAITAEITPAVTAALPIAGAILGIGVAFKLYKRFAK